MKLLTLFIISVNAFASSQKTIGSFSNIAGDKFTLEQKIEGKKAEIQIIKKTKDKSTSTTPKIEFRYGPNEIDADSDIKLLDLDSDTVPEVIVTNTDPSIDSKMSFVFGYNGATLNDLTPLLKIEDFGYRSTALVNAEFSTYDVDGQHLIWSYLPRGGHIIQRLFQFSKERFQVIGNYDWHMIAEKTPEYEDIINTLKIPKDTVYVVEVKNISSHTAPVKVVFTDNQVELLRKEFSDRKAVLLKVRFKKINTFKVHIEGKMNSRILITARLK